MTNFDLLTQAENLLEHMNAKLLCLPGDHRFALDATDLVAAQDGNLPVGWQMVTADMVDNDDHILPVVTYNPFGFVQIPVCGAHVDAFKRGLP